MTTRRQRANAVEAWAAGVEVDDLRPLDSSALQEIVDLTERRDEVVGDLADAVRRARASGWSWSWIGAALGVTKQAAQQKYGRSPAA